MALPHSSAHRVDVGMANAREFNVDNDVVVLRVAGARMKNGARGFDAENAAMPFA